MEVSGQFHAPAALALVLTEWIAGWAPEPVWTLWSWKNLVPVQGVELIFHSRLTHIPGTVSAEIQRRESVWKVTVNPLFYMQVAVSSFSHEGRHLYVAYGIFVWPLASYSSVAFKNLFGFYPFTIP